MRTRSIALAAALAAAALPVSAQPRMEGAVSPFTYEALGATPSLSIGKARRAPAVEAGTAAPKATAATTTRAAPAGAFTYEALGATPHVEVKKPASAEAHAPQNTAR